MLAAIWSVDLTSIAHRWQSVGWHACALINDTDFVVCVAHVATAPFSGGAMRSRVIRLCVLTQPAGIGSGSAITGLLGFGGLCVLSHELIAYFEANLAEMI